MIAQYGTVSGPPPISRGMILVFGLGCALALTIGLTTPYSWLGVAGLTVISLCFTRPVAGLTFVVSISALVVWSTEEITPYEIGYFALFAVVWLGWSFERMSLGQTFAPSSTDRMFAWFMFICLFSAVPAYLYGNEMFKWLRELVPFLFFLPYLIIVRSVNTVGAIKWLCLAFTAVCFSIGIYNLVEYSNNALNAEYLWELVAGRRAPGEPLFFTTLTVAAILICFEGFRGTRTWLLIGVMMFCGIALAVTFSRGYWVAALLSMGISYFWMPDQARRRMLIYGGLTAGLVILITSWYLGPVIYDLATVLGERVVSILGATVDISLRNRIVESSAAFDEIMGSPIWGYGLGFYYTYVPLIPGELPTWYVHNAYLYLWLKLGLPGLVAFLAWYVTVIVHGYRAYRANEDAFVKPLLLSVTSIMLAMIPLSITSPQYIQKDSILFLALAMGFIEIAYRETITYRSAEV